MDELLLSKKELKRCKEIIENSIKQIVNDANSNGAVLGLSGGIDSAVVAKLASNSVDVCALIMPEREVTPPEDIKHAEDFAKGIGIRYSIIEINDVLEKINDVFPWPMFLESRGTETTRIKVAWNKKAEDEKKKMAWANVKPRTRMIFNYLVANLNNRIVLGTGNRTEILLGYATKYGDGGVDIQPIGDLYKTQVRQLAKYIGIPKEIIEKPPSAGLWKGQTDEVELGATYDDIDCILYHMAESKKEFVRKSREESMGNSREMYSSESGYKLKQFDPSIVKSISGRVNRNEHKRILPRIVRLF